MLHMQKVLVELGADQAKKFPQNSRVKSFKKYTPQQQQH